MNKDKQIEHQKLEEWRARKDKPSISKSPYGGKVTYPSKEEELKTKVRMQHTINPVGYYGIADAHGIESFQPQTTGKEANHEKFGMQLRAEYNRQRHAIYYEIQIEKHDADIVNALIDKGNFIKAFEIIKKRAITIGFPENVRKQYQNSWELIPNPKLDPWR